MPLSAPGRHFAIALGMLTSFLGLSQTHADNLPPIPLQLMNSSAVADLPTQTITFSLTFNRSPDLQLYDVYNNAADEFAIDILNMPGDHPMLFGAGGEDVRILSSQYRDPNIMTNFGRMPTPPGYAAVTTPRNLGSTLETLLPLHINGPMVTFTAPYGTLGEIDGNFEAVLQTYRYGSWSGQTWEVGTVFTQPPLGAGSLPVPEPASVGVMGTAAAALLLRRSRRRV